MVVNYRARLLEADDEDHDGAACHQGKERDPKRDLRYSPYPDFGAPGQKFSLKNAETKTKSGLSLVEKLAEDMVAVEMLSQAAIDETRDYSRPKAAFVHNARIAGAIATMFLGDPLPKIEEGRFRPSNRKEMTVIGAPNEERDKKINKGDQSGGQYYIDEPFRIAHNHIAIARNFLTMFDDWPELQCLPSEHQDDSNQKNNKAGKKISAPPANQIWQVSINRDAVASVNSSHLACKADAARLLFNVDCKDIIWAVADSGINAHHPAFFDWRGDSGRTRVLKTYDFTELRESLSLDRDKGDEELREFIRNRIEEGARASLTEVDERHMSDKILEKKVDATVKELNTRLERGADVDWTLLEPIVAVDEKFVAPPKSDHGAHVAGILGADWPFNPLTKDAVRPEEVFRLRKLELALRDQNNGKEEAENEDQRKKTGDERKAIATERKRRELADNMWDGIKELPEGKSSVVRAAKTTVPKDYEISDDERCKIERLEVIRPESTRYMTGMCPDIKLYDFRVLRDDGQSDEFEVIAALQFIRFLNARAGATLIHGVNLSFSIEHNVVNYACGNTPVCEECNQLSANGTVVIAAAGNLGHTSGVSGVGKSSYNSITITDPGNAEAVITVGATHCYKPHIYGPSYFSSRGPTGDGRLKPDLVAPGEKITAPVGIDDEAKKDGTSMAAPHVSGAAAILMARHVELVGQPAKIKQILCDTATDLGRERYFQGAGMLDVLRALQSV